MNALSGKVATEKVGPLLNSAQVEDALDLWKN